jgi:hypothetical protein
MVLAWFDPLSNGWQAGFYVASVIAFALGTLTPAASRRDGLFTLGDMGYVDEDGYRFLCDRQAEVVISGGANIYPAGVEARGLLLDSRAHASRGSRHVFKRSNPTGQGMDAFRAR